MNGSYAELHVLTKRALALCEKNGWGLDWRDRGCYLHLESSELVEAMRGKGDSTVTEEAGDVLFVLLTILGAHGVEFEDVVAGLDAKMKPMEAECQRTLKRDAPGRGCTDVGPGDFVKVGRRWVEIKSNTAHGQGPRTPRDWTVTTADGGSHGMFGIRCYAKAEDLEER